MSEPDVIIVGAGLAGLACALGLQQKGISFQILESAGEPGGRVRTDHADGFQFDRGFQVLLTAYPECRRLIDYGQLRLGYFRPGALVFTGRGLQKVSDPFRDLPNALATLTAPVGSLADKLRMAMLRNHVCASPLDQVLGRPEVATIEALAARGFSPRIIERFFRPFLGGIFLEPELLTSSRKFDFVFRMFAQGLAALPARGMQAIPQQLAAKLPPGAIRTRTRVQAIDGDRVVTAAGEVLKADRIVVATQEPAAARLLHRPAPLHFCSCVCLYYDAPEPPIDGAWLVLNGSGEGPVNNVCVPTAVRPDYGPAGRSLVSATVLGNLSRTDEDLDHHARLQLLHWFGPQVETWKLLRTYRIDYAVPFQTSVPGGPEHPRSGERLLVCGDYTDVVSIHGALRSGSRAAEAIAS